MPDKIKILILSSFQVLLLIVPLLWTTNTSELFEFPKILMVYSFTIIITTLWLIRMVRQNKFIFTPTALFVPLMIFLGSQIASTIFSIDTHTSIFGYYSRFNGGLLSVISYLLLYFAAVSNLNRKDGLTLIKTIVFAGIISSLYAFPEHFGHSPSCQLISGQFHAKCWVQDVQTRVFGTFGQPNWLAAYLIAIIYIPLSHLLQKKSHLVSYATFLLFFIVLLFTKSRSGLVGFSIGYLVFIILSIRSSGFKLLISSFLLLTSCFLLFGRGISATTDKLIPTSNSSSVSVFPSTSEPANSLELNITPSSKIRQIVWQGAWVLAKQNPLFGTGVETFGYSYYNVRPIEHNLVSEWDFLYNKAHNEFLNFAATTGFLGLGAYLFFLGSFIIWALKIIFSSPTNHQPPSTRYYLSALVSGFIALCISNFFGFSTVPVQLLLYLFPAISFLLLLKDKTVNPQNLPLNSKTILFISLILITAGLLLSRVYRGYLADIQYTQGKSAHQKQNYQVAINHLQNAVKAVPNEPLYTDELALTASEIAASLAGSDKTTEASQAAAIAIELANRTLNLNRVHLNFYKSRTKIFINLSQVNPTYAVEAAASLDAAIRLAPTDAKLWFNRGLLTEQLGYPKDALKLYRQAIDLKQNYDFAQQYYDNLSAKLATAAATKP